MAYGQFTVLTWPQSLRQRHFDPKCFRRNCVHPPSSNTVITQPLNNASILVFLTELRPSAIQQHGHYPNAEQRHALQLRPRVL